MNKIFLKNFCPITEKCYNNKQHGTVITYIANNTTKMKTACLDINYEIYNQYIILPSKYYHVPLDFIINDNHELFLGFAHCCLSNNANFIYGGGRIKINQNGEIYFLDNMSGHYQPQLEDCFLIYDYFQKNFNIASDCVYYLIDPVHTKPHEPKYNQIITKNLIVYNL